MMWSKLYSGAREAVHVITSHSVRFTYDAAITQSFFGFLASNMYANKTHMTYDT